MVFSSLVFLYIFLPLNLMVYFISKNKTYRNWVLIVFSLSFYSYGEPVWVSLLIFSATIDYFHGRIIEGNRGTWKAKAALISSVIVNLSLLGIFKYSSFFIRNIGVVLSIDLPYKEFMLPLGISFYTFQTISYVVDVYRGDVKAQREYPKFLLFVSLFHQLVAGPIVRYVDIESDIENRQESIELFGAGILRFVTGLLKKVIIANTAGEIAGKFLEGDFSSLSVIGSWLGITLFAIQIYFDFSGYSDMAIGLGKMFGFRYRENFDYPYISRSATEFWRRWHISLGSFFRDYVYIPLGGNRKHHIPNLLIVWFLTGLWHGASWNFVLWGIYYGILIIIEKLFLAKTLERIPRVFSHIYLVLGVLVGWVFFYFVDFARMISYLRIMFGLSGREFININTVMDFKANVYFIILSIVLSTPVLKILIQKAGKWFEKRGREMQMGIIAKSVYTLAAIVLATLLLIGTSYNPFLYFRF